MRTAMVVTALSLGLVPAPLHAQKVASTLTVGPAFYRFTENGRSTLLTARFTFDLGRYLQMEPSMGYMLVNHVFKGSGQDPVPGGLGTGGVELHSSGMLPELAFTLHTGGRRWAPYVSAGVGASWQQGLIPKASTLLGRVGIRHQFSEQFGFTVGAEYRSWASYGHTVDLGAGFILYHGDPTAAERSRALIRPSGGRDRFAFATGAALPTKREFGFFPTARLEWYVTDPNRRAGIVADGYVARAFGPDASTSLEPLDHRGEVGFAVSVVPQLFPKGAVSPYVSWGIRWRHPWDVQPVNSLLLESLARARARDPNFEFPAPLPESRIEPNIAAGLRVRLPSGQAMRLEVHYYSGLNYFPVTVGFSF